MKYRILDKDGAVMVLTSKGSKLWIKPDEWGALDEMMRTPFNLDGNSYRKEFDEDVANNFLNMERLRNPERDAQMVEHKDFVAVLLACAGIFLGILGIISLGTLMKSCSGG